MDIPEDLLREFCEYVVKPFYEGGISEAIMDLMRKAVEEQKKGKPTTTSFSFPNEKFS
jgi:metal-responsive CopG/Arc/MetJ family transcriptional regulator